MQGPATSWGIRKIIELSQFDLILLPWKSIRGQALAYFIVEFTTLENDILENNPNLPNAKPGMDTWNLYIDGARSDRRSSAGVVLWTPEGRSLYYALRLDFSATNNDSE